MAAAAVLSGCVTPVFARYASARRLVVQPRPDRWHRQPVPLLGGAAIALASMSLMAVLAPGGQTAVVILVAALAAFMLGLLDDFRHLAPTTKLVGQVLVASILVIGGIHVSIVPFPPVQFLLTVFWVVGVMNAVNLIDNMDGLAAGVAAIAAIGLGLSVTGADPLVTLIAAVTAGAAIGFLAHNFFPARVFMGDAGSQLLGFLLAAAALLHSARSATNLGIAVLGPLVVLAVPIFDTALVATARRIAGRPISQGGRDHTSHRLAALGLSDRTAVLVLYGVAIGLAALGVAASTLGSLLPTLAGLSLVGLVLFGLFLGEVNVYGRRSTLTRTHKLRGELLVYLRFGAEVGIDVVALTIAYYTAYLLRFEGQADVMWIGLFIPSLPIVVGVQLAVLVITGVYRSLWRYLAVADAVRVVRATSLGTALAILGILVVFRFEGYSRAVFVLDWLFINVLIIGSRVFLLWLRQALTPTPNEEGRRVLIIGATDTGALAARLLRSGGAMYRPVGIIDDDPGKRYRQVAGIPIVGTIDDFDQVSDRLDVDLVVLALEDRDDPTAERIRAACNDSGIECRQFLVPV